MLVADAGVLDGEGILVGAGRGLSRLVVGHCLNDTAARRTSRRLSPAAPAEALFICGHLEDEVEGQNSKTRCGA